MSVLDEIKNDIASNDVVIYMKGTKAAPRCGFSAAVIQIFNHLGVDFKDVDVLSNEEIREGIKQYNNWPTVPQIIVKGEFIGGCDIVREMFQTGELQELLKSKGIETKAA